MLGLRSIQPFIASHVLAQEVQKPAPPVAVEKPSKPTVPASKAKPVAPATKAAAAKPVAPKPIAPVATKSKRMCLHECLLIIE
jgi:hypothetical protein